MVGKRKNKNAKGYKGKRIDSIPLDGMNLQEALHQAASFTRGRRRGRGRRVLVSSLPHVAYHIGSSWRLCKLLGHQWLWLLPSSAQTTELLAGALGAPPARGGAAGPIGASSILLGRVATGAVSSCPIGALSIRVLACLGPKGRIGAAIAAAIGIAGSIGFTAIPVACRISPATVLHPSKPPVTLILIHQIGIVG